MFILKGRKNKRIDILLGILMKIVRDKMFDKLIKLKIGHTCQKIRNVHDRHENSKKISEESIVKVTHEIWK